MEVAVPTRMPRASGYPTAYKVDIAHPMLRLAIEVDGNSHGVIQRRAQDAKKDALLSSLGWTVLRFSNREIASGTSACAQEVLSTISMLRARRPT